MAFSYEVCVDYDTLCALEERLNKIIFDLMESTGQMSRAIQVSQEFLSGNQFEKAKNTTSECLKITETTSENIRNAMKYLETLRSLLDEYGRLAYSGEDR